MAHLVLQRMQQRQQRTGLVGMLLQQRAQALAQPRLDRGEGVERGDRHRQAARRRRRVQSVRVGVVIGTVIGAGWGLGRHGGILGWMLCGRFKYAVDRTKIGA